VDARATISYNPPLVEGRLQQDKELIVAIVSKCMDLTKMLGKLVQREADDLPVLTLSRADEKSAPYLAQNKPTQVRQVVPKEEFHGSRILNNGYCI
jgi:error-prone DNA polymerase